MKRCWDSNPDKRPRATEICKLIDLFQISYIYDKLDFKRYIKTEKEQQHYEIEKQFKEAEEYRKFSNLYNDDGSNGNNDDNDYYDDDNDSNGDNDYDDDNNDDNGDDDYNDRKSKQLTTHPQAIYTSRLLNPYTECLDCAIDD